MIATLPTEDSGTSTMPNDEMPRLAYIELQSTHHIELRQIRCISKERCLVVSGTVPSFYLKQVVQGVLQKRFGTTWRIDNQLDVVVPDSPEQYSKESTGI